MFLIVRYEDMSINEQMQHRIGNLPAFRILSQAGYLYMAPQGTLLHAMVGIDTCGNAVIYSQALAGAHSFSDDTGAEVCG